MPVAKKNSTEVQPEGTTPTVDTTEEITVEETPSSGVPAGQDDTGSGEEQPFTREYVEKLRREAAAARVKAKRADDLARELFHHRVTALGKMADPSDLAYDEALLEDGAALEAAVDELLARKPHLGARRVRGDVGQGARGELAGVDLAGMLRSRAG